MTIGSSDNSSSKINGVIARDVITYSDNRGSFAEIIKASEKDFLVKFGQLSWSLSHQGVKKAWHIHKRQTDLMFVACGDAEIILYDNRENSSTYKTIQRILAGDNYGRKFVIIPPQVAHGYHVVNGPMHMIYMMDREYDPEDELRLPHDDPKIGFDWVSTQKIK
jgi:dTDP-4-dehydrorhamnose 3,5-epimerase